MPKRSSKPPEDENVAASRMVDAISELSGEPPEDEDTARREAARLLGSLGGRKGGPARAKKLSKARKKEIARKAARARWKKR